jgi:hypothetical protein
MIIIIESLLIEYIPTHFLKPISKEIRFNKPVFILMILPNKTNFTNVWYKFSVFLSRPKKYSNK